MTGADLERVLAIERRSYTAPWSRPLFERELLQRRSVYLVGLLEDVVVGYIGGWTVVDEIHITTVAVDPALRGRNLSDRLLMAFLRRAVQQGVRRATLEVRSRNQVARNLYRKYGFIDVAIRRGYYTDPVDDAVVMWVHDIDDPEYAQRLAAAETSLRPLGTLPDCLRNAVSTQISPLGTADS